MNNAEIDTKKYEEWVKTELTDSDRVFLLFNKNKHKNKISQLEFDILKDIEL